MNFSNFTSNLQSNGISTGSIKSFYSFAEFSGGVFFNDLYSKDDFIVGGNGSQVALNLLPLVSLRSGSPVSNSVSGSGYFDENQVLRIGSGANLEDWTIFLNLKKENFTQGNLGSVLFSTQNEPSNSSGFTVGINSSDRMFLEYGASDGNKIIHTHPERVGDSAIYSFSKQNDIFQISKHDFLEESEAFNNYTASGYVNSSDWYLGNFKDFVSVDSSDGYTGYSGYLDNTVLVEGGLSFFQQQQASRSYIQDTGTDGFRSGFLSGFVTEFTEITGVTVNLSGVTGTGITGFESVYSDFNIPTVDGKIISGFTASGVTGELLGLTHVYLTGTSVNSGTGFVFVEAQENLSQSAITSRASNAISFQKEISATDEYEIYGQSQYYDTINVQPSFLQGVNSWYLTVLPNQNSINTGTLPYTGGNINVYREGHFIYSGTGFSIFDTDELAFESRAGDLPAGKEHVLYDYIYGEQSALPSDLSFTGNSLISTTDSQYKDKDIYFSESGTPDSIKLVSGLDWSGVGSSVQIGASARGSGIYLFAPLNTSDFNRATGLGDSIVYTNFNLINEQVWLNGVKQLKNRDYITFSSGESTIGQYVESNAARINFITDSTGTYWNF